MVNTWSVLGCLLDGGYSKGFRRTGALKFLAESFIRVVQN